MGKIGALWNLFRVGQSVENPGAWKTGQITATVLAPVIVAVVAVLKAYGYALPIDDDAALALAGGIVVAVNVVLTLTTSKHVGVAPARADSGAVDEGPAPATAPRPDAPADGTSDLSQQLHDQLQTRATDPFAGDHGA